MGNGNVAQPAWFEVVKRPTQLICISDIYLLGLRTLLLEPTKPNE